MVVAECRQPNGEENDAPEKLEEYVHGQAGLFFDHGSSQPQY